MNAGFTTVPTAAAAAAAAAAIAAAADTGAHARAAWQLEQPLPPELTGSVHGWLGRYRIYPVFSAAWARGRLRSWGLVWLTVNAAAVLAVYLSSPSGRFPLVGMLFLALELALPMALGPWLASRVRRRGLPAPQEWRALLAAIAGVVLVMGLFHGLAAAPLKLAAAKAVGEIDAEGKRKTVRVALGLSVLAPDTPSDADGEPAAQHEAAEANAGIASMLSILCIIFVLAGGGGLFGYRKELTALAQRQREHELRQAQAARREVELRLSVLAAQVEPHFLFNTLAGVRSAVHTDPARASDMIDRLVDYLRASIPRLRGESAATATVAAQADIVRAYLGLMAARMPRLGYSIDIPPALLAARCPPLLLISLAENAIKHGVEPKIGPAHVTLRAEQTGGLQLTLSVADDGVGFAAAGVAPVGSGLGLVNVRERLATLYGAAAALTLKARPGGGVVASITLPLEGGADPAPPESRRA